MSDAQRAIGGMILAAGYGTRLAPITEHVPKPLLPVGDRSLLGAIVDAFDEAEVQRIGVNSHHLGDQIVAYLESRTDRDRFVGFPENEILGTGGALDGAREFLEDYEYFLLHNGDVLCDANLIELVEAHRASNSLATLLLVDWPAVNSVTMAPDGTITSIAGAPAPCERSDARALTYSGIGVFSNRILADIGPGFSSLIDPLTRAMALDANCVRGWAPAGVQWSDLGTLPRLLEVQSGSSTSGSANLPAHFERITGHGSDRRFWRLHTEGWSAVAMQTAPGDAEFGRQIEIGRWLYEHDLGAPEILSVHEPEKVLLTEDLGCERLYELAGQSGADAEVATRTALDLLARLQRATPIAHEECPTAIDRTLGRDDLRWETDYFRERFLVGHLGLDDTSLLNLDDDFEVLAGHVAAQPLVLLHRDFQSQNIHLQQDRIRLVDFQGMRLGPIGYDAASVIFDPYVDLGSTVRERLLDHFCAKAGTAWDLAPEDVRPMVLTAGLQRIQQALGAYGFLGHIKGKDEFLKHIPAGCQRLKELLGAVEALDPGGEWSPPLPRLRAIVAALPE